MTTVRRFSKNTKRHVNAVWPICAYCGQSYRLNHYRQFTIDHVLPVAQGGTKDRSNLVGCCYLCNRAKGNRTPQQWAADILSFEERRQAPAALAGELS